MVQAIDVTNRLLYLLTQEDVIAAANDEEYLKNEHDLSEEDIKKIQTFVTEELEFKVVFMGSEVSEIRLGGDDVISIAKKAVQTQLDGWELHYWYGPNAEVLIIGLRGDHIQVID